MLYPESKIPPNQERLDRSVIGLNIGRYLKPLDQGLMERIFLSAQSRKPRQWACCDKKDLTAQIRSTRFNYNLTIPNLNEYAIRYGK